MTTPLYNRSALEPFTRANSDDVNNELAKVESAVNQLQAMIESLDVGAGTARYTWTAYADSDDGTLNFSHDPGNRAYVGLASNKLSATPSDFPEDYTWSLIRGSDAPTLRLVASAPRFNLDHLGRHNGANEILFTVEATNISTAVAFSATNDSGNAVTLVTVNATQVKLTATDFGAASWVRVVATANGGAVSDSVTITSNRDSRPVTHRGKYRSDVTYNANDAVERRGSSFLSKHDTNLGNTPVDSEEEDTHWSLLARRGDAGDPATPPGAFSATIAIPNTPGAMVNLHKLAKTAGYIGKSNATLTFNVANGIVVTGREDGGIAIDTGLWPDTDYTVALILNIATGGIVRGGGGNGGFARGNAQRGATGGDGGDAIFCRTNMTVNIAAGGELSGGGGGGDGGSSTITGWPVSSFSNAGGGGGGFPNGLGGVGAGATPGATGTPSGGGDGGGSGGNDGGDAGAAASVGGAGGYAVRKNGNTVTVNNSGTMNGTAA